MSNYSSREIVRSPGDAPTTNSSSPTSDFLIKGKSTFSCPVRIYPVNGSFTRSDDDAGIVTVSHDKKKIYCPTKSMREVTSFEFDDVSDRTTTNAEFFDQSIAPCLDSVWQGGRSTVVLCGSAKRGSDIMAEGDSSNLNRIGFIHMASANFFQEELSCCKVWVTTTRAHLIIQSEFLGTKFVGTKLLICLLQQHLLLGRKMM